MINRFYLLVAGLFLASLNISCEPEAEGNFDKEQETEHTTSDITDPNPNAPTFLVLSDIHLNSDKEWTVDKSGDTGTQLWTKAKYKLNDVLDAPVGERPEFIVYLGDMPRHDGDSSDRSQDMATILRDLREISENHCVPLAYLPGNNDALNDDYCLFTNSSHRNAYDLDVGHTEAWPLIVTACDATPAILIDKQHRDGGYYSAYPLGKESPLRLIAMNTSYFSGGMKKHCPDELKYRDKAAFDQLDWLGEQIDAAAAAEEKVILAMHVPPGNDYQGGHYWDTIRNQNGKLAQEVFLEQVRGQDHIIGILYGHSHEDELKVMTDERGNLDHLALSCPGITPQHGNNPGFKTVSYRKSDLEWLDFTTYWSDYFSTDTAGDFVGSYTFDESYGEDRHGELMTERLAALLKKDKDRIETGMSYTYKVKADSSLSGTERGSIFLAE